MRARLELVTQSIPEVSLVEGLCRRAEDAGWDGISFTDSQNLVGDPFLAVAVGAACTERLRFMTGVTNAATRHPAALATVAATAQEVSGGRFALGIGRGDTALFHLGRPPMPTGAFFERVTQLHGYLNRETVDLDGHPSRLAWLDRARQPTVPVDIAASGPKVLAFAARTAERVTLAVGADPERVAWALELARAEMRRTGRPDEAVSFGAYVNVGCHPDRATARDLIRGGAAAFAHFSAMPGSTGAGLRDEDRDLVAEVGRRYDSNRHLSNTAAHSTLLEDDFLDRFAVVGRPEECMERLGELADLGLERFVITGPTMDADPDAARVTRRLIAAEIVPALHQRQ